MTLREDILTAADLPIKAVPTPEWEGSDGTVSVRVMNAKQRLDMLELFGDDARSMVDNMVELVVATACDCAGVLLFTTADTEALCEKNGDVIQRIATAAQELNGFTASAAEATVKNSEETTPAGSPSS